MQNDTCYILALVKRDDGERILLGSGFYEFTKDQKHFNPNTFANDIVELQGADGQLLAGQVRRSTAQSFDGYIGDGTTAKTLVEQKRREFFLFFRKQHHYTVVYIMPDGTAIKRDRGYIVDAPAVQELYQVQPKWHVSLAFEDVNYYSYAEDDHGNEVFSFEADLSLASVQGGGLKWDANGAISTPASMENIRINGDTFQKTYTGKNLASVFMPNEPGTGTYPNLSCTITDRDESSGSFTINMSGSVQANPWSAFSQTDAIQLEPNTKYTLSRTFTTTGTAYAKAGAIRVKYGSTYTTTSTADHITFTTDATGEVRLLFYASYNQTGPSNNISSSVNFSNVQLEKSETTTSFEQFVGGAPAPSPDFPQAIQTVTGSQTVTIGGTSYTVDLGATELCKLDTYQDYIWKDGDDWKVHKATNSITYDGSADEGWARYYNANRGGGFYVAVADSINGSECLSTKFINDNSEAAWYGSAGSFRISSALNACFKTTPAGTEPETLQNWQTSLGATPMYLYYPLATPTDTAITDAGLIAQLEAVAEAMAEDGKPSNITPTGTNLPAIITGDLSGTGGYEWEAAAGGGPSYVTVNGVDDALPVWYVTGPCVNPTLTNSTTGISITWTGTVPSGQTLIVDMGAQTATMEGANVFQFISGSWLTLSPGTNRIAYTAANTTVGSKLYWNEIVG